MISFFRKIRQSLIDSSSVRKYFIYAIGEISLVVIGILIALQVNNWNEARKSRIEDRSFLKSLKKELEADTSDFRSRMMVYQNINRGIAESEYIIRNESVISAQQDSLISRSIRNMVSISPIEKNTNRNDAQISQGRLEQINPQVNENYLKYIQQIRFIDKIEEKLGLSLQDIFNQYFYPHLSFQFITNKTDEMKVNFDYKNIYKNPLILNGLNQSYRFRQYSLSQLESILDAADSLIIKINEELEN